MDTTTTKKRNLTTADGPCDCGEVACDACGFRYVAGTERCAGDPCSINPDVGICRGTCRALPCNREHVAA